MNFFVSTTAFRKQPIEQILDLAKAERLNLEFSSGLKYRPDMEDIFLNSEIPRLPHNYFPAPEKPFVLNIASTDPEIQDASVAHCMRGLSLAAKVGAPFYSAHAGFCLDPRPQDLGETFDRNAYGAEAPHWKKFIEAVKVIGSEAKRLGIKFLIENNVVIKTNLRPDGSSPLFCATPDDALRLMTEVQNPHVGLLLDTGHLKVSANTLKFDPADYLEKVGDAIFAIHHSDNSGSADTNHPIKSDYWFLKFMPRYSKIHHVLEVHDQSPQEIATQRALLEGAL